MSKESKIRKKKNDFWPLIKAKSKCQQLTLFVWVVIYDCGSKFWEFWEWGAQRFETTETQSGVFTVSRNFSLPLLHFQVKLSEHSSQHTFCHHPSQLRYSFLDLCKPEYCLKPHPTQQRQPYIPFKEFQPQIYKLHNFSQWNVHQIYRSRTPR